MAKSAVKNCGKGCVGSGPMLDPDQHHRRQGEFLSRSGVAIGRGETAVGHGEDRVYVAGALHRQRTPESKVCVEFWVREAAGFA